ncbi:phospholipid:diacylglycerol acyltransferase [Tilletia horrida]|uniref:Phospholipid:diacylglycerol acyltransferase n=1 Tax=Tilletia horrida TaxID=155126 RepID=A0AAN6GQL2_9BASI|nr:phospholipid:diacylglycerol acyltransferase [Tilletia horrida]KAK0567606.1 phospholipid:diacylglycerol acyltransferase [Tilletia horrida]
MARRKNAAAAAGNGGENGANDSASSTARSADRPGMRKRPSLRMAKRPSMAKGTVSYTIQAPADTPFHELDLSDVEFLKNPEELEEPRGITRYRRVFFIIGTLLGAVIAWLLANHTGMDRHMSSFKNMLDDQLSSIGLDLPKMNLDLDFRLPTEFSDLGDRLFTAPREWLQTRDFQVGRQLSDAGYKANHPVILLPGIISTGLESWTTNEDASGYFRKRLWGTTTMMRTIVFEKDMWVKHLSLDPHTGLDPPGIKVRAAEGLDAASYFITGYWIWSKVIENLAVIGYDSNNLWLAAYDWRLSMANLEIRDHFFTRLKQKMEQNLFLHNKKTVLVSHSMGSTVFLYFMKWVEAEGPGFGNGGPDWVERHVEAFTSIAGTFLGVPKAMSALLSGEMRDTVELPPAGAYLLEKFFSRQERAKLFRSWAGSACMLIKGGETIWGNHSHAPDDIEGHDHTHGQIYSFKKADNITEVPTNMTATDASTFLLRHAPSSFQMMIESNYSNGFERNEKQLRKNLQDPTKWTNPLEAPLPNAPSMKIFCMYGTGKPTERSYWYQQGQYEHDEFEAEGQQAQCLDCENTTQTPPTPLNFPTGRKSWIDNSIYREGANPKVRAGCKMGEGDGTVSLLSLGAMCVEGWKQKRYNPAGIKVVTHEMLHAPEAMELRGGQNTGDHVDILGASKVNDYVLRIAAGRGEEIKDYFVSDIQKYAAKIAWD